MRNSPLPLSPQTSEPLKQHIKRAHLQSLVWGQAVVFDQVLLDPTEHDYHRDTSRELQPTTTDLKATPKEVSNWPPVDVKRTV